MVTTLLGAIEVAGVTPLPLTLVGVDGVVALLFGRFLSAALGCGCFAGGAFDGAINTSLLLGTVFGGGVRVLSRAWAAIIAAATANGGAAVDDDEVNESTICVTSASAAAATLTLAGVTPPTLADAAAALLDSG